MKFTGYGAPRLDGHEFRFKSRGRDFCSVISLRANPYTYHTLYNGCGERWLSILDEDEVCSDYIREIKSENGLTVATIARKDNKNYTLCYKEYNVTARDDNGRVDFMMNEEQIGFVSEIRDAKGERVRHPAANELRIAEFNDELDVKLVMLLLGTEYLEY